ncbi:virion structural protein [Vibrio phage phi 3]|uniref:Lipoprotein n=1 Tax=Vibrio phage phi 3 TaxID=1589298 RepID=A0A0B5H8Q9_9CAUD|nr:virion structural protein [Vibrio phage phi 3]AJF40788.1 hypothetical protein SBVP3_0020 [Vibrio phage phi 3]
MKTWQLVTLLIVLTLGGCVGTPLLYGVSVYNTIVNHEKVINKRAQDSENVLSNYTLKIQEMAQVPSMYTEDLKSLIKATFEGRYGQDGSKATFQWIQEKNLPHDSKLYTNLQAAMEAGRDEFRLTQTAKIEVCEEFKAYVKKFPTLIFAGFIGKDENSVADVCKVVSDSTTKEAFKTGIQSAIKLTN